MYVCLCKAVCDKRVKEAIDSGAQTVDEVGYHCGAGTDCGSCHDAIEGLLESHGEQRRRVALPMLHAS